MKFNFFKRRKDREKSKKAEQNAQIFSSLEEMMRESTGSGLLDRCEQVMENAREIDDGKKEYYIITSYLNDIELIENLPPDKAEEIRKTADFVTKLNRTRDSFLTSSKKISDAQFQMIQRLEDEIPREVKKLRENEDYQATVRRDMQYLEGEKQEWELQKKERVRQRRMLRKASFLLLGAAMAVALLLFILSSVFGYNTKNAWLITILVSVSGAAAIVLCLENGKRDMQQADVNINYAVTLLNKVKIKYVIITNAVDYACEKFHVRDSRELSYQWDMYQEAVREHDRYRQTNEDLNYYHGKLVKLLQKCELYDARIWIDQPQALVEPREMVEIKHGLLVRRQKLRSKIAYNLDIVKRERDGIDAAMAKSGEKSPQLTELIRSIDKMAGLNEV